MTSIPTRQKKDTFVAEGTKQINIDTEDTLPLPKLQHTSTRSNSRSPYAFKNDAGNKNEDDFVLTDLLSKLSDIDEDICLARHGYKRLNKICDTLQGALYKAIAIKSCKNAEVGSYVAIKATDKDLYKEHIAIQDGISECVAEDICKEALILKHLTVHNKPVGNYIVKYIDFFASNSIFYLVMEYIQNGKTLTEFVRSSHKLITEGKLSLSEYSKAVKCIMWQLAATVNWMLNVFSCCHLDLWFGNVMVLQSEFLVKKKGGLKANRSLSIKIGDFGVAEFFRGPSFKCFKQGLTVDNEAYVSPQIHSDDIYDARSADMWSLGMILYECVVGEKLYVAEDMWLEPKNGYLALRDGSLRRYLECNNLLKYFRGSSFCLLKNLLKIEENTRIKSTEIIKHQWFKHYYQRYAKQLKKKIRADAKSAQNQTLGMSNFPSYSM